MKKLLLIIVCFAIVHFTQSKCSSPGAVEGFILSTNALPTSSTHKRVLGVSLVDCTRLCLEDLACKAFTFSHNGTERECRLAGDILDSSQVMQEDLTFTLGSGAYFMEKVCLKGACDRLFIAESLRGMELEGHTDITLTNSTRLSCLESCLITKEILCISVEYDSKTAECRLSRHDRFNRKMQFKKSSSPSIEYFDVTCSHQEDENTKAEIIQLGHIAPTSSLVEYQDVTAVECSELCLQNILFPCRAFFSGYVDGRLYCGLTHQVQSPSNDVLPRSLDYYEISSNINACHFNDLGFELISGQVLNVNPYSVVSYLTVHECLDKCKSDRLCMSVVVDSKKQTCQFSSEAINHSHQGKQDNAKYNYFEKVCLPGAQCTRDWMFERLRSKQLVGADLSKTIVEAHTKEDCQIACLLHQEFACRSAEFNYQLKECQLSPYNRFSATDKVFLLADSVFPVDYFENNCIQEPRGFCNTRTVQNLRLLSPEQILTAESIEECRKICYETSHFVCRSLTFDPIRRLCSLSHHTRRTTPPGSIAKADGVEFMEIGICYEVSVDCRQDKMLAHIKTNTLFKGKVYTKEKPLTCFANIKDKMEFRLPIALTGSECGTISEKEGKFSNILVIQSNDHVVTAMDKAIGVHCSFDVGNKTEETDIYITDPGSSDKSRGSPSLPDLSLHIVDMKGEERDTVSLGELLRVQVRMSDEDTYGIFVRNLVAKDGSGANNLTLIDNTGCPVEVKMMREVRTIEPQSKSLEGYLEAFTFTGSSILELEAEVETCLENCKPVLCQIPTGRRDDDTELVSSFGRRKRDASILATVTLTKSLSIEADNLVGALKEDYALPVTAPSLQDLNGLFQNFGQLHHENSLCFEPTLFALIAGCFFLIEICGFSACLVAAFRWKRPKHQKTISIHYADGSD